MLIASTFNGILDLSCSQINVVWGTNWGTKEKSELEVIRIFKSVKDPGGNLLEEPFFLSLTFFVLNFLRKTTVFQVFHCILVFPKHNETL